MSRRMQRLTWHLLSSAFGKFLKDSGRDSHTAHILYGDGHVKMIGEKA
jgi:prepilin-type processing-associated H-X9-DG protein